MKALRFCQLTKLRALGELLGVGEQLCMDDIETGLLCVLVVVNIGSKATLYKYDLYYAIPPSSTYLTKAYVPCA